MPARIKRSPAPTRITTVRSSRRGASDDVFRRTLTSVPLRRREAERAGALIYGTGTPGKIVNVRTKVSLLRKNKKKKTNRKLRDYIVRSRRDEA